MLLDTGSDITVLPESFASVLGIDLENCRRYSYSLFGIKNRFGERAAPEKWVDALVADMPVRLRPEFSTRTDQVVVLGRWDFCSQFLVHIDEIQQLVGLEPYPEKIRGQHPHPSPAAILDVPPGGVVAT
jgi:hypothetical protein